MKTLTRLAALALPLTLAACAPVECDEPEAMPSATFDLLEEDLQALEAGFDLDREDLPCDLLCTWAHDADDGTELVVDGCASELLEPSDELSDVAAHVTCDGEIQFACE